MKILHIALLSSACLIFSQESVIAKGKSSANTAFPEVSISRIADMPDLTQTDKRVSLPGKGKMYCAPVSVSNSLVWLARHGFPNLARGYDGTVSSQASIARVLGVKYMKTKSDGTNTNELMMGLHRYVTDAGYRIRYLAYSGWRNHAVRYSTGKRKPSLEFIKRGALGRATAWLNLGWYKYDPYTKKFTRVGGHWVTLVGYGATESGAKSKDTIILNDPSARNGRKMQSNYVKLVRLNSGVMIDNNNSILAKGFYAIGPGMRINKKADYGIIDGVVLMCL